VRWDRVGRLALLAVIVALLVGYGSAGISLLTTWQEAGREHAAVRGLRSEYGRLSSERATLESPLWVETQARRLGMLYPGERQYIVRGLPDR
jgi:hypothetical protein